ncbi:MAG: hypothetical protein Q9193_007167, partial [Seirophora villosa]
MDGDAKEASPEPSSHGLKSILTKARRGGKNTSVVSINDNESDTHAIRSSIDSSLRVSGGSSLDDARSINSSNGISKLMPNRIQKKRRERKAAKQAAKEEENDDTREDDGRGRSISGQAATAAAT